MLRHTLLLIFRNFKRFKSTFFINVIGLSTGLACALCIYLWVSDELNVDKFHKNDKQLYQVNVNYQFTDNTKTNLETDGILAEALAEEMPEVDKATVATPIYWFGKFTVSFDNNSVKAVGRYAGKDYFNIFSYSLFQGNKDQVLARKDGMAISRRLAMSLFNTTENLLGKVVEFQHKKQFVITGVFENTPPNSTDQFDFVIPFKDFQEEYQRFAEWDQAWPRHLSDIA